ncbi:MAG: hypothetical protein JXA09_01020 [Anaerolineae bacterium]|nr:hypothetical protein [Anaerolineae bacterium]
MLTWPDVVRDLANLSAWPMFVGLVIASSIIVVARDWRFWLWALLIQYVLVSLVHLRALPPELALLKLIVGVLVCPMLYWAARWVETERAHRAEVERERIAEEGGTVPLPPLPWPVRSTHWTFRLLAVFLLGLVLYSVSRSLSLPFVDPDIAAVCIWLWLVGLLVLVLTPEPLPAGIALLTLIAGFDLFFDALSPGLVGTGVLAAIHLLTGLAISYLTTVRELTGEVL